MKNRNAPVFLKMYKNDWFIFLVLAGVFALFHTLYNFKLITFEKHNNSLNSFRIFNKLTPSWFNWFGWILILSALEFISNKTNDTIVKFTYFMSLLLIFVYLKYNLSKINFKGNFFNKHKKSKSTLEAFIAAYFTMLILQTTKHLAEIFTKLY